MSLLRRHPLLLGTFGSAFVVASACSDPNGADTPTDPTEPVAEGGALPERAELPVADAAPDVDEEPSDAAADGDAGRAVRVFVTSTIMTGNLLGLAGGDAVCTKHATDAALGGTWVAWLSNGGGPHAVDRVTSAGPWRLVTGETVAQTKAELTSGVLLHAIDRDELGVAVASGVWTGTGVDGRYLTNDCDKWTGAGGNDGRFGDTTAVNGTWTSAGVDNCGGGRRLYCFEL